MKSHTLNVNGYPFVIDAEDLPMVEEKSWCVYDDGKGHVYLQASLYMGIKDGKKVVRSIRLHRYLMGLDFGDRRVVDHIDGNTLNNQKSNLRVTDYSVNASNRKRANGGPLKTNGGYMVRLQKDGVKQYYGFYKNIETAKEVFDDAYFEIHGEPART